MKTSSYIRNDKGIALVVALVIMLLLLVLGAAAMQMSQHGFTAISAEKKYQIANWAAEYAVQEGIRVTAATNECTTSTESGSAGAGSYTYYRVPSSNLCYIHGTGTHSNAKVVKTVVVPRLLTSELGAITLRNGGSLSLGGSSSIVNCDTECKTPGVVYGTGLTLAVNTINDDTTCPNNPRGIYGSPNAVQDIEGDACNVTNGSCSTSPQMSDRIPVTFEADNWTDLLSRLSIIYSPSGYTLNVSNLSISEMSPLVNVTVPVTPDPPSSCECTNTGNFTLDSGTSSCTGVANIALCSSLEFTSSANTLTIDGTAAVTNVVSNKNVQITGSLSGKNVYTIGSASITINNASADITNSKLISNTGITLTNVRAISTMSSDATQRTLLVARGGNITLNNTGHIFTNITLPCTNTSPGVTCETALVASGDITLSGNVLAVNDRQAFSPVSTQYVLFKTTGGNMTLLSNNVNTTPRGINYLEAEAQGSITISGSSSLNNSTLNSTTNNIAISGSTTNDSILVTASDNGDILFTGGTINRSTLLTKDLFSVNNSANATIMTDNELFAMTIHFVKGMGDISGGLFYSQANTAFLSGTGNTRIGCVGLGNNPTIAEICQADCNPVLFIIGGNLVLEGTGTVDIFGTVFVNGVINYTGGGGFAITGSVVSNSTTGTSSLSGGGNANIRFSSCIMNYIRNDHTIARRPACGSSGGARSPYIANTKVTVY